MWSQPAGKSAQTCLSQLVHGLPDYLKEALQKAAAEDAPEYVQNKRFIGAIAKMAGDLLSKPKPVDSQQLSGQINQLGGMKNMGPDLMSDSVKQQQEMTGEVEKEVADKTIQGLFAAPEKKAAPPAGGGKPAAPAAPKGGTGEMKAEIDFIEQKGMVQDDLFAPPGMKMKVDVEKSPKKQNEKDDMSPPKAFSYPMGMGGTLMNGCFGTGYVPGDPCYKAKRPLPPCLNLMEGCYYIGVGFDGRGEYSSVSRRKTVIQRKCSLKKKYHGEEVPDQMNVHGVYDSDVSSRVFEGRESFRQFLQQKAGVSFSGWGFQGSVNSAWGGSSKSEKQMFMSLIEADIIRYEIFLDEVKPTDLTLSFLRDFLSLPKNFIIGKAKLQEFIIRYGTHYIKSAKFGGSFQLYKTQEATKSESLESFSVSAQASYSGMFSAGAHYGRKEESGSASSQKSSSTHLVIEGGDQKVAGIVADFYTTSFKDTFTEWLKSVPSYPKPIEMFMGTLSELLNLNFKLLFPFDVSDAADGCFSKKYCDDTSVEEFQLSMDKKRLALERAIAVYMEEGPIPTTDFHLKGGKPGCQTDLLMVKGGDAGVSHPSWLELINGDTYKIFFDLQRDVGRDIRKDTEAYVVYSEGRWNCHHPGKTFHAYNSWDNGGSGDTKNKKIFKYLDRSNPNIVNSVVGRVEYVSPLEHSQSNSGALANILEAPCEVKWSNSYQIKPAEEGGKCLYFVAASKGDIFVVFSAIPRDKTTWYHLQISFQGVALYKGLKLIKYEGAKSARSLGDSKLFQPYFICIEEDMDKQQTYIRYGIGSDNSEKGLIYMVYTDESKPIGIRFYSFGSGENDVEIMDARIIEGSATGEMECTGGTVMVDGRCVEDCHPECNGETFYDWRCIPKSPGSKLDTECRLCQHFSIQQDDGTTKCVGECPEGKKAAPNGATCICEDLSILDDNDKIQCVTACPDTHEVGDNGVTCEPRTVINKWRHDDRCGPSYTTPTANPGQCDPESSKPCCSPSGYCGDSAAHCTCPGCIDYRPKWREDWKCGPGNAALGANPAQCDPTSGTPCCSPDGWCGASNDHCQCSSCWDYRNVARGKAALATSTAWDGAAARAVDGNTDSNYGGGSCTHTNNEANPSWRVDLGMTYAIDRVVIYNRRDCCGDRLNNFNIHIGDNPSVLENPKCGGNHQAGNVITVSCSEMQGRYVFIRLPGSSRALTLCEVQVYPCFDCVVFSNVALGKRTVQTSGEADGPSSRAVDGNTDTNWGGGSCTHTRTEANPAWRVDLGQTYQIDKVNIYNRRDCCSDRLDPFNIYIGNSETATENPKCGGDHRIGNQASMSISCNRMRGRYVFVRLPGSQRTLTLCEVQVIGAR
uniref:MACPF domain-containing protein n=1 Tax=Branchiostoma floridae TaxID=7739 RepID=C3ZTX2_BRAFL|eukprot:XP_002588003.1 hypothetical protein BRAFLDRAFT_125400 [Branchiostoma floridae]